MKKRLIALLLIAVSLGVKAEGTKQSITILADKVVINTDSLGLPSSASAYEVLTLLPNLVERTQDYILQNYDIQINGKTVGSARDAVLHQIRISDLRCIEVSENTLSSVSSMGSGGAISLELRPATKGLSGSINTEITNEANYAGGLRLDDCNGKWTFRGIATVENYVPKDYTSNRPTGESSCSSSRAFSEIASGFIEYKPNKNNLFKLNVSEVYTNDRQHEMEYMNKAVTEDSRTRTRNLNTFIGFNYDHQFSSRTKLCLELNYRFIPEMYNGQNLLRENDYDSYVHNFSGDIKLQQALIKPTTGKSADLEFGVQYNTVAKNNSSRETPTGDKDAMEESFDSKEFTHYIRPYAKIETRLNKWRFMGTADFQHFAYDSWLDSSDRESAHICNNVTGQAVAMYAPNQRNLLRLRYVRSITRPEAKYLFPYLFYDPIDGRYILGNSELTTSPQNAVDLDYSINLSTSDYHLEIKASTEYSHTYNKFVGLLNEDLMTYCNLGHSDVLMGDLGVFFREGHLSVWLSGNVYHKMDDIDNDGKKDHYTYYNFLIRNVINLGRGWMVALKTTFNSAVKTDTYKNQGIFYGGLRISKTWKHFNAYVYGIKNFLGIEKNEIYFDDGQTITYDYEYMHSSVGFGLRYAF